MKINKSQLLSFFSAFLLFLFIDPYFMWWAQKGKVVYLLFGLLMFGLFALNLDIKYKERLFLFAYFILIVIYAPLSFGLNVNACILALLVCTIPFAKKKFACSTYDNLLTIYSVVISLSGIVWLMTFVGAVPSLGTIEPLNELKNHNYIVYPLLVVGNSGVFSRFYGPFDEPGVVGTISIFFLTISEFNLKDKRLLAVFITGFFSLSFFYYGVLFAYFVFYLFFKKKKKKYAISILVFIVAAVAITYNNDIMYDYMWSRFEWDSSNGTFAGDNRLSPYALYLFDSIIGTPEFYFGINNYLYYEQDLAGSSSIILTIIQYGIIYVGLYISFFLLYGFLYKKNWSTYLFFVFVFLGTLFQRPCLMEPEYLFCFSLMATNYITQERFQQKTPFIRKRPILNNDSLPYVKCEYV